MTQDAPYEAPIPHIYAVDDEKLRPIKAKLKAEPPEPISMEEATLLLQSTTYLGIKGLSQVYDSKLTWKEIATSGKSRWDAHGGIDTQVTDLERDLYYGHAPRHWGRFVRTKCDNAMNLADVLLQELPDSMVSCFGTRYFAIENHVALILSLPIIENGVTTQRHFLIDPTLGQFFYKGSEARDRLYEVGERMMAQDADFANTLLSQGYTELTEAAAKTYVTSFAPELLGQHARDVFAECGDSHLKYMLHDRNGYTRLKIYDPNVVEEAASPAR